MISPSKVVTNLCMWSLSTVGSTKMLDLLVRGVVTIGNTIKIKWGTWTHFAQSKTPFAVLSNLPAVTKAQLSSWRRIEGRGLLKQPRWEVAQIGVFMPRKNSGSWRLPREILSVENLRTFCTRCSNLACKWKKTVKVRRAGVKIIGFHDLERCNWSVRNSGPGINWPHNIEF